MNSQGSFELEVETIEAEGKGCGLDYLDIQVISAGHIVSCALRCVHLPALHRATFNTPTHVR